MAYRVIIVFVFFLSIGCTPLIGALLKEQQDASSDTPGEVQPYCQVAGECPDGYYCRKDSPCEAIIGLCTQIPTSCPSGDPPVCGCDGTTYDNFCELKVARAGKKHDGACGASSCTAGSMETCGEGYTCDGVCGNTEGSCVPMPEPGSCAIVEADFSQVCGCKGELLNDYPSDCDRIIDGAWFDHYGPCGSAACTEGNPAGCGPDQFCEGSPGMCGSGAEGWCERIPDSCDGAWQPVCGCDRTTYGNDCMRKSVGVWQRYPGECRAEGECIVDIFSGDPQGTCDSGYFCELREGACVNFLPDPISPGLRRGQCVNPTNCGDPPLPCAGVSTPAVCDCSGVEYQDDCQTRMSMVNVNCCSPCDDCLTVEI